VPLPIDVDQYIESVMRQRQIPGLALAVVREDQIVKAKGYGYANLELSSPVTDQTVFQSGSVGKMFTATAVMLLVEDGRIHLDDPITKYFPEGSERWKGITIRHLLNHTSGIPNFTSQTINYRLDYTDEELLQKAISLPLDFEPGSKWTYSNTAYVLLGFLIERVSGRFYGSKDAKPFRWKYSQPLRRIRHAKTISATVH
jgi:CubicO group peptidase (beta-lactamase class C family)